MNNRNFMLWRVLGSIWLILVLALNLHQWQFWNAARIDTDVLALLPQEKRAPEISQITQKMADQSGRKLLVLLGGRDWENLQKAAQTHRAVIHQNEKWLRPSSDFSAENFTETLAFYRPHRDALLTSEQRAQLRDPLTQIEGWKNSALLGLLQPTGGAKLTEWVADPLNLWTGWWTERAKENRPKLRDGWPWFHADGQDWIVLAYEIQGSVFAMNDATPYAEILRQAAHAAHASDKELKIHSIGLVLYAEAAAAQAHWEINFIGLGSLFAVITLAWLAFRSFRSILLVGGSLLIGCAAAVSVTAMVFGKVHLLTLVFGTSLVGVAEDFGIHYFSSRQSSPAKSRAEVMQTLIPGLALALLTSVLAYLALGIAPFPGLRQMAVFSATGLCATFLTVVLWFPLLDHGHIRESKFSNYFSNSLPKIPRFSLNRNSFILISTALLLIGIGISRVVVNDDLRQLQSAPKSLTDTQREIAKLLETPSPAQFFLVQGITEEQLLINEEKLKIALRPLVDKGIISGWQALSDWVPSIQQQRENKFLSKSIESPVLNLIGSQLNENLVRPEFAQNPLTIATWLEHPASAPARHLWQGNLNGRSSSIVLLKGLNNPKNLPHLSQVAIGMEEVRWIDKVHELSTLLGQYRQSMLTFLVMGHALVFFALSLRYGRHAWRAWTPTALASLVSIAVLGYAGVPFQLFNVLALMLLLGTGIDYGIFLLEPQRDGSAWLAIVVGATSTLLSFGLLALSATPALHAFGLTLLVGIATAWLLAPIFRLPDHLFQEKNSPCK